MYDRIGCVCFLIIRGGKFMKRITSIIVSFCMIISMLTINVMAYSSEYDFINMVDGMLGNYIGTDKSVSIPETIYGDEVSIIGADAFSYNTTIQDLTMPDTVVSIEFDAFRGCTNLTSITISPNIRDISSDAFLDTGIYNNPDNWENGVLYIGNCLIKAKPTVKGKYIIKEGTQVIASHAFDGCNYLSDIEIPQSVRYIGSDAFFCTELEEVKKTDEWYTSQYVDGAICKNGWLLMTDEDVIPKDYTVKDGITKIAGGAFSHNENIESITLPEGVTTICEEAFFDTKNLNKINFPDSLETIGAQAFCGSGIQEVKCGKNLREIDTWAFSDCNNLERVEFPDGFSRLRYGAFHRCQNLKTLLFPDTIWKIAWTSFWECDNLKEIFYFGTTSMWKKFLKINEFDSTNADSPIAKATVYFTYEVPDFTPTYVPTRINEVKITGKGTAYARFILEDKNGDVARLKTVYYSIDGAPKKSARTDINGCVRIPVENIEESGIFEIKVTGADIQAVIGNLKVTVEDLKFTSTYEAKVVTGARVGVSAGVGGGVSEIEVEASAAEAGAGLSSDVLFSVSQEYDGGKNKLTLTAKRGFQFALDAKAGLFAGAKAGNIAGIEAKAGEISGKATLGTLVGMSLQDEDFDVKDKKDLENVGKFMLCTTFENAFSNAIVQYLAEKLEVPINSYEKGDSVSLDAGASILIFDIKSSDGVDLGEVDLGGIGTKSVWGNTTVTNADESMEYRTTLASESGVSLIDFKKKNLRGTNLEGGGSVWGTSFLNDELSISAKEDESGALKEICFTAGENKDSNIFWAKETKSRKMNFIYTGEDAAALIDNNSTIDDFTNGWKPYIFKHEWEDIAETVLNSYTDGEYTSSCEHKQGFDIDISGKVKCIGDLGINLGVSGIEGYEYATENGFVENNTVYVQSKNDIASEVADKFLGVDELCALALGAIAEKIEGLVEKAVAVIDETVDGIIESGQAVVEKIGNKVTGFKVSITKTIEEIDLITILAVQDDVSPYSTASLATTVANPYVVKVENEDGEEITDFEENPLLLTLGYTEEQLTKAGVWDENDLHIMYWDEEKCVYVNKGGELDVSNKKLSLKITKPGQYVLAVDNCPPAITQFISGGEGKNPQISAIVSDMSGISDFSFKIDGEEYVSMENLEDFYDYTTGKFLYTVNGLSSGEHTASIYVEDTLNNSTVNELLFNVDTEAPVIESFVVPEILTPGCEIEVTVAGEMEEKVFLNMERKEKDGTRRLWTKEMDGYYGYYYTEFPQIAANSQISMWVSAVGTNGNITESEKKQCVLEPLKIKFYGSSFIECNNSAELEDLDIIIASYDENGVLVAIEAVPMEEGGVSYSGIAFDAAYAKAFLWKDMQPLCVADKSE